jgi:hypothetical protein
MAIQCDFSTWWTRETGTDSVSTFKPKEEAMPYRAMALVAASLLFATQSYAWTTANTSKSNNYRRLAHPFGHNAPVNTSRSNTFHQGSTTSGSGAGKTAKRMNPIQPVRLGNGTAIRNQQGISDNDRRSLIR